MTSSSASTCPDLIVLCPGFGYLSVLAFQIGLKQKALLWRERVECSGSVDLDSELPPLLGRHALRLQTPAALITDSASGGFLLAPGQRGAQRDQAWIARQLELALPYRPQELRWRTCAESGQVEIFWLPTAWIESQMGALARLGLQLTEVYPRACLWREEARQSATPQPCLLLEADALHVFEGGLVRRSAPLPAEPEAAAQAQQLERLALGSAAAGAVRKVPSRSQEALAERVLKVWLDGSDAIHLAVGRWAGWASWQPALRFSAAVAAVVAIAAIGLSLQNAAMDDTVTGLAREQRKLAPVTKKFVEMESSIRRDRQYLAAAKVLDASLLPLDGLSRVSAALPDRYWIQHLRFEGETLELAGRGGDSGDVIGLLGDQGIVASAAVSASPSLPADAAKADGFSVRLPLKKMPGGDGR